MNVQYSRESIHTLCQEQVSHERHDTSAAILQEPSTPSGVSIMMAEEHHLALVKRLSEQHKHELGFVNREILRKAISTRSLLIAAAEEDTSASPIGMVHFYMRRDSVVALYSIAVAEVYRRKGIGRLLFNELVNIARTSGRTQIRLKCPTDLPANVFYQHLGLEMVMVEPGKRRPINVWEYNIEN